MNIWMDSKEIDIIKKYLKSDFTMLEWGSGGSTIQFPKLVEKYYSIEHDKEWFDKVNENSPENVEMFHVNNNKPRTLPTKKDQFIDYINFIDEIGVDRYDAVLIDGRARGWCAEKVLDYIDSDSKVFIHDYWNRPNYHIVENWYNVIDSVKNTSQTIVVLEKK